MLEGANIANTKEERRFLFLHFIRYSAYLTIIFILVFYGTDYLTIHRSVRYELYFSFERQIPYLPITFFIYYSVFALPFAVPIHVMTVGDIRVWANASVLCILVAGLLFLIFPSDIGYVQIDNHLLLKQVTHIITSRHNLVPSLHVALTTVVLFTLWRFLLKEGRVVFLGWGLLLITSTLTTHQHHIIDILSGALLGWSGYWLSSANKLNFWRGE